MDTITKLKKLVSKIFRIKIVHQTENSLGNEMVLFFQNGEFNSNGYPSVISRNENMTIDREWYHKKGKLHRENGPAFISYCKDGCIEVARFFKEGEEYGSIQNENS